MIPGAPRSPVPSPRGTGVAFVTGAGGFIGRHVASAFLEAGWRAVGFGYRDVPQDANLNLRAADHWVAGRLSQDALSRAAADGGRPEVLVHAAGGSTIGASLADPRDDFVRNVESTRETIAFLRKDAPEARLVFLSSAAVCGGSEETFISECTPAAPLSPYGRHKKLAEDLVRGAAGDWNLDATVVRLFSVYGPGNRKQLLWEIASRLQSGTRIVDLSGSGEEARDFLYIDDATRLIGLIAGLDRGAAPPVINGGSGVATTVREAAEALCRTLGAEAEIAFTGLERRGDPRRLVSGQALARQLGFSPETPFAEGLSRFVEWARQAHPQER